MSALSERFARMRSIEEIRGIRELAAGLQTMLSSLANRVPEDIVMELANLQGLMDWFQVDNDLELDPQRIEAEYYRWSDKFETQTSLRGVGHGCGKD